MATLTTTSLNTKKAIGYCEQALPIDHEINNRNLEAGVLANLGNAYLDLCQLEKVIGYYEQALVIRREIKDRFGEAIALVNLEDT